MRARFCGFASGCGAGSFGGFACWLDGGSGLWAVSVEEWGLENVLGFAREELALADERVFFPECPAREAGDRVSACDCEVVARLSEVAVGGFGEGAGIVKFRLEKAEDRAVESGAMATTEAIASQRIARARTPDIRERFLRRVVTGAAQGHFESGKGKSENGEAGGNGSRSAAILAAILRAAGENHNRRQDAGATTLARYARYCENGKRRIENGKVAETVN